MRESRRERERKSICHYVCVCVQGCPDEFKNCGAEIDTNWVGSNIVVLFNKFMEKWGAMPPGPPVPTASTHLQTFVVSTCMINSRYFM